MSLGQKPISRSLKLTNSEHERAGHIEEMLAVVDQIHWCGSRLEKPLITIADYDFRRYRGVGVDAHGMYDRRRFPPEIVISEHIPDTRLVFLHELGHLIDHWFLGSGWKFASGDGRREADIERWYQAVQASPTVQRITQYMFDNRNPAVCTEIRDYILQPEELWACSYAQFIAEVSESGELASELDRYRQKGRIVCRHWPQREFADSGILDTVKEVLRARDWLQ